MEILNDGSVKGKSFSGKDYKGEYLKEFAKKNNLSLSGKKELVNLLSRAKWED